jgi:hypothetical protein
MQRILGFPPRKYNVKEAYTKAIEIAEAAKESSELAKSRRVGVLVSLPSHR